MLDHIKAGNLLLQLAVTPETRFRYTFPYRSDMFENDVSTNPYLGSLIFDAAPLYSSDQYSQLPGSTSSSSGDTLSRVEYRSLYQTPFHAAQVVDTRLFDANPSMWTTVCSDDALMRDLLGVWLRCEYHFTAAFQKDLFLEDMAAQREDFCSSLLVNIVLAYSCVQSSPYLWRSSP